MIQRPGARESGYGSGWDMILPRGWGMPFWLSLAYAGGRAVGLSDIDATAFESMRPVLPLALVDTPAGAREAGMARGLERV